MDQDAIKIRLMRNEDFDAVVGIDRKITQDSRRQYYELKFDKLFKSKDYVPASLVAEDENGAVVGFVMGELYLGEYGILQEEATLDTIGVDPDFQHQGIGERLMHEFMEHMRSLGVEKINTLVHWNDANLIRFFSANKFSPSKTINLERVL
ncbi:MAG: GNAT family N-acetyltransferase [Proteobacteria bacterium]|nr:GNAT family N-acetyltransferase [Pseudomonadota bacterium]MBU4277743.1 GNAT family N-acetyltransferase [Pseudomonadota bacterium]MBU4385149.1 GNAT family N-acetyltransferase [Pseudomonadota bacterium]MBU4603982.1 GNAT family N-acetyltransferase [Pseudomonadota bacterium]MCG2764756.1 GNAT family N-acetyltransferase [Desulfarculaceae bacterium]